MYILFITNYGVNRLAGDVYKRQVCVCVCVCVNRRDTSTTHVYPTRLKYGYSTNFTEQWSLISIEYSDRQ